MQCVFYNPKMHTVTTYSIILALILMYAASADEPICGCSNIHNLEYLLEKLVRMEIKFEQIEKQQSVYQRVNVWFTITCIPGTAVLRRHSQDVEEDSANCFKSLDEITEMIKHVDKKIDLLEKKIEQSISMGEVKECAYGWVKYHNSCYLFWNTTSLNFSDAAVMCGQYGAHLVFVETADENTFLKQKLQQFNHEMWWMGLTDQGAEGTWKYDGTDTVISFIDWAKGQPDNAGGNENCAHFWKSQGYQWNDYQCPLRFPAVCEKHVD